MSGLHSAQFSAADEVLRKRILALDARVAALEAQLPCPECGVAAGTHLGTCRRSLMHGGSGIPLIPFQGPVASQPRPAA